MIFNTINIILLILVICLFLVIFYNMFAENKLMKNYLTKETEKYEKNRKKLMENFESAPPETVLKAPKSLDSKYHDFPLSELAIKSSYNSAIDKDKKATKDALANIIKQGYRLCDLELYTRSDKDDKPQVYVSHGNGVMESEPELTIMDALNTIASNAFSGSNDPIFIQLRVIEATQDTYKIIVDALQKVLSNKLMNGKVTSATTYREIMGKAIIVFNYSLSQKCYSIQECNKIVNIYSGSMELPCYDYVTYSNMNLPPLMVDPKTEKTDNKRFYMVLPGATDVPLYDKVCNMFLARDSEAIDEMFAKCGYAVCPLGKIQNYMNNG